MGSKIGKSSLLYTVPPTVTSTALIGGPMEGEGLLGAYFDRIMKDNIEGHASWEKCESAMLEYVVQTAVQKEGSNLDQIDCVLGGDLLNQLIAAHFAMRSIGRPFLGLYGACSTMAESMLVGAALIDGGFVNKVVVAVSSHHETAERQYRFPTELGVQRPLFTQWTVTGAGAAVITAAGEGPKITAATIGRIIDMGIKDPNAMGPAMAPAAADTLYQHFIDTGRLPSYYDMIFTGDLGSVGKELTIQLLKEKGYDIAANYEDCGCMIYHGDQDVHAGASGCASSAVVFCGYIYDALRNRRLRKVLLVGTGCLHSPTSYQQKESIPCIAHAVAIEN